MKIIIREAKLSDEDQIWVIIKKVIASGTTYVFYPNSSKHKMIKYWHNKSNYIYVAEWDKKIVGTFIIKPNQPDLGSHIANAAYMVHPDFEGNGIGKKMCLFSLNKAKELGFIAMQFNLVIKENKIAVILWKKMGFQIIGEIPNAIRNKNNSFLNAYIMYQSLK